MPTDGAFFGRAKVCYGKAFTMAKNAADSADVAEFIIRGVERDIKLDGGAPAFPSAITLLSVTSQTGNTQQLLSGVETISRAYSDSPFTRHIISAVEELGISAINQGHQLSQEQASEKLIVHLATSRCCDGMSGYITRNRTKDIFATESIIRDIKEELPRTAALRDLGARMRDCSEKGLPAKAPRSAPIRNSADLLDEEL